MNKIKNNILLITVCLIYFFMTCVNIINIEKINGTIMICLTIITMLSMFFSLKDVKNSKIMFIISLFLITYYISMIYLNTPEYRWTGMFPVIAMFSGFIISRILGANKENINKLIFVITIMITFIGLVSIDMVSFNLISAYLGLIIKWVTGFIYLNLTVFEEGVRMKSIITNPNIFASLTAISIFLNLYLSEKKYKKKVVTYMLLVNIAAFLYAFSLGATLFLGICMLIYLIINRKNNIMEKIYFLGVTFLVAIVCVGIGINGMGKECLIPYAESPFMKLFISFLPLGTLFFGGIILLGLVEKKDKFLINVWPKIIKYRYVYLGVILLLIYFGSWILKPVQFNSENQEKNISFALAEGEYKIQMFFDRDVSVNILIYGQNDEQAGKREYDVLCEENVDGKEIEIDFSTYEKNKNINIKLKTNEEAVLHNMKLLKADSTFIKNIKMDYALLPDFIENRLSPFSSNQNSLQRFTFFIDGLKIWLQSPIIGNGPSAFENNYRLIQTSNYSTWSSHNFFIDTLCDVGIVGILCISALIIYMLYLVIKKFVKSNDSVIGLLGVIIIYMLGHSFIEINFIYIPYIFTFGILCGIISVQSDETIKNKVMGNINLVLIVGLNIVNIAFLIYYFGHYLV